MHDDSAGQRFASSVAEQVLDAATDELRRRMRLRTAVPREFLGRASEVAAPERYAGPRVDLGVFDDRAFDLPAIQFLAEPRVALAVSGRIVGRTRETAIDRNGATYRVEDKSRPGALLLNGPLNLRPDGSFSFTVLPEIPQADRARPGFLYAITVAGKDVEGRLATTTMHIYAPNPALGRHAPAPDLPSNGHDLLRAEFESADDRDPRATALQIKGLHLLIRELKDDRCEHDESAAPVAQARTNC